VAIEIPEHFIPSFKPAKIFVDHVKLGTEPEGAAYEDDVEE
jgi:hypothetical protein